MKRSVKKGLKIALISLGSFVVLLLLLITVVINFVFTSEKLTPMVLDVANKTLNAKTDMKSVELTFFSTFPEFGLRIENGSLVSRALRDTIFTPQDTLVSFRQCIITVNPLAYLRENKISVHNLVLQDASVYAFSDKAGKANWNIMKPDTVSLKDTTSSAFAGEINIDKVRFKKVKLIFDDRSTGIYSRIDDLNMELKASLSKKTSMLKLDLDNRNILFWQNGELLVNKVALKLKTDISIDRATHTWALQETSLAVNDINLDVNGSFVRDTSARTIDVDLTYGLHAPSLETVLSMIPESVVKKGDVSAKGGVLLSGNIKGVYGKTQIPSVSMKIQIKDGSAQYKGLPYGIDLLTADFEAYIDLMRKRPSTLQLKIFRFQGAHTDILADGKVEDLLGDPYIVFNTKSKIDLSALAKTFPLQEGVEIGGTLTGDLGVECRLSVIKNKDFGRVKLHGDLKLDRLFLKDKARNFDFSADASFHFIGKKSLEAGFSVQNIALKSPAFSATALLLSGNITSSDPLDTTRVVDMDCKFSLNSLTASMGDSISVFSGQTSVDAGIRPSKRQKQKPVFSLALRTDSLFAKTNDTQLKMDMAGFDLTASTGRDSLWRVNGAIGFNKLYFSTPELGLPIRLQKTKITLERRTITLHQAKLRIGRSNFTATGSVHNLGRGFLRKEPVEGNLSLTSRYIDCNQLIDALSGKENMNEETPADTTSVASSEMRLFVVPPNIDFRLNTDIKKVRFNKLLIEDVHGLVVVKNQSVNMEDLSMKTMDASMKLVMLYKASEPTSGYTGFDLKIKKINIGNLVKFIPELDTIVPMLKSFKGVVNFDIAAEADLDSLYNIRIPSLKAALHLKGDSLVLMDGETFAEVSKMLMFKNKKENVFESVSVNITVDKGVVKVYPFLIEIDRYKAAVGGEQNLDMSFNYHISILKSPLPFKAGVDVYGNFDKIKYRITKAKYKDMVTPVYIQSLDSTRINMSRVITSHIKQLVR